MKINVQKSQERGTAEHDWLHSHFSFSFAEYYNPKKMGFGTLRVLNDDIIDAGSGFPTHPHDNMEIVTIVLEGALKHKDSMGNEGIIPKGDVQRMSAGTGVRHSEFNASQTEQAKLLQIWVYPKKRNIEPSYEQKTFLKKERKNKLQIIVSGFSENGAMKMNQDGKFVLCDLEKGKKASYSLKSTEQGLYVFVIKGKIKIATTELSERDTAEITEAEKVELNALTI